MTDHVFEGLLESALEDCRAINARSEIARLRPEGAQRLPTMYRGRLVDVEHLERDAEGSFVATTEPVDFSVRFPSDYCRSQDPQLQFKIVRVEPRIAHPNVRGGNVCLGHGFRPSTRLLSIVQTLYLLVSGRVAATADAFDHEAATYYLRHADQIRALRAAPLWRRPLAASARVVEATP